MTNRVYIADLHLSAQRPKIIQLFLRFADEVASNMDELYILGDFVEYWLGDDDPAGELQPVLNKLMTLNKKHQTQVYLMHGNRDFLMGKKLAALYHFKLIEEPYSIAIGHHKAILMHGDILCSDDIEYQKLRKMVRSPQWQKQLLTQSLEQRKQFAKKLRTQSKRDTANKDELIMDVNQKETNQVFIENNIDLLIHGHTHRMAIHQKIINQKQVHRIVLGDWYKTGNYLHTKPSGQFQLHHFK